MLEIRTLDWHHLHNLGQHDSSQNSYKIENGVGYVLIENGQVLGAGGLIFMWPGVSKAWTIVREGNSGLIMRRIHHAVKTIFKTIQNHMDRVEAEAVFDSSCNSEWLKRLGFEWEGNMSKFRDKQTYARFGMVK